MTTTAFVVSALGWAAGRAPAEVGLLVVAFAAPHLALPAIPVLILRNVRNVRASHGSDVLTLVGVAAELRVGSTLRRALINVAAENPQLSRAAALARAGRPMSVVLDAAGSALGRFGGLTAAALGMAAATGGSVVTVVDQLVAQVMALDELERERRAAMAPILMQAVIVGGVPAVSLVAMAASGRLFDLATAGPFGAAMVSVGAGLVIAGTLLVTRLASRAVRA